jgi:V/A-type H+-transporting ATPase subunit E
MGCRELIDSLKKEGDEKVLGIWREAEEEAGRICAGVSLRLGAARRKADEDRSGDENLRRLLLEAETRARLVRLASADKLSRRLYARAVESLPVLRTQQYEAVFERLALGLPAADWQIVRVNPADKERAGKLFPRARIVTDISIAGGMDVEAEEGRIRVINTLEKRLERIWPRLLPELLADVSHELIRDLSQGLNDALNDGLNQNAGLEGDV